jgi:hypothetical protein
MQPRPPPHLLHAHPPLHHVQLAVEGDVDRPLRRALFVLVALAHVDQHPVAALHQRSGVARVDGLELLLAQVGEALLRWVGCEGGWRCQESLTTGVSSEGGMLLVLRLVESRQQLGTKTSRQQEAFRCGVDTRKHSKDRTCDQRGIKRLASASFAAARTTTRDLLRAATAGRSARTGALPPAFLEPKAPARMPACFCVSAILLRVRFWAGQL